MHEVHQGPPRYGRREPALPGCGRSPLGCMRSVKAHLVSAGESRPYPAITRTRKRNTMNKDPRLMKRRAAVFDWAYIMFLPANLFYAFVIIGGLNEWRHLISRSWRLASFALFNVVYFALAFLTAWLSTTVWRHRSPPDDSEEPGHEKKAE